MQIGDYTQKDLTKFSYSYIVNLIERISRSLNNERDRQHSLSHTITKKEEERLVATTTLISKGEWISKENPRTIIEKYSEYIDISQEREQALKKKFEKYSTKRLLNFISKTDKEIKKLYKETMKFEIQEQRAETALELLYREQTMRMNAYKQQEQEIKSEIQKAITENTGTIKILIEPKVKRYLEHLEARDIQKARKINAFLEMLKNTKNSTTSFNAESNAENYSWIMEGYEITGVKIYENVIVIRFITEADKQKLQKLKETTFKILDTITLENEKEAQ